jgi:hypothetical protein
MTTYLLPEFGTMKLRKMNTIDWLSCKITVRKMGAGLVYAGELYQDLVHLFKTGKLPPEVQKAVDRYRKELAAS